MLHIWMVNSCTVYVTFYVQSLLSFGSFLLAFAVTVFHMFAIILVIGIFMLSIL